MKTQLTFRKKISALWGRLTGDPFDFTIEHRIFHAVCLIVVAAMAYFVPLNYFIGLPVAATLCFVAAVIFFGFYYRSRVMAKMNGSIVACILISNVFFFLNYFYNSGVRGPNDILFALSLFLIFSLSPPKQHKYWIVINITLLVAMHAIEYFYPRYVPNSYHTMGERIIDLTSAYIFAVIAMYFTIKHIRRNYDYEKNLVEEKKQAIEVQNEHILTQNEQLEQLNSEKNKLMSIIAHDLRGPLSNIQNYLELVTEYGLDKEEREVVEGDLLKVTQSTLNMLSKLLIWSKSQMDGVVVKLSDVNLSDALKNTMEMERILAIKKEITLTYEIDPSITVVADSDMLQLVVRNLVSNAIKFTAAGGWVDVSTAVVMNECKLSIKDSGRGIPYEQQGDIFSLKARSTFGTNNEKGVGLGLLLCKEFTDLQGGRIGFESTPGHGSNFFIFMPIG